MTRSGWNQRPLLLGMVHLQPLPGAPRHRPGRGRQRPRWLAEAIVDARTLAEAGFDGVVVENFGDAPFYKDCVPPVTVASMAIAAASVREALPRDLLLGINVLRNDATAALGIAAACGADLIRVNVLTGAQITDQGIVEGRAAEWARLRRAIAPDVRILADIRVKHASPLGPRPVEDEVRDLIERGGADGIVVSGPRTGAPADMELLRTVASHAVGRPVYIGSGTKAKTVRACFEHADGVIVGTSIRRRGRVDPERARKFVKSARGNAE